MKELINMLEECLDAFNRIPNTKVKVGVDTYQLASKLGVLLKDYKIEPECITCGCVDECHMLIPASCECTELISKYEGI